MLSKSQRSCLMNCLILILLLGFAPSVAIAVNKPRVALDQFKGTDQGTNENLKELFNNFRSILEQKLKRCQKIDSNILLLNTYIKQTATTTGGLDNYLQKKNVQYLIEGNMQLSDANKISVNITLVDKKINQENSRWHNSLENDLLVIDPWFRKVSDEIYCCMEQKKIKESVFTSCFLSDYKDMTIPLFRPTLPHLLRSELLKCWHEKYEIDTFPDETDCDDREPDSLYPKQYNYVIYGAITYIEPLDSLRILVEVQIKNGDEYLKKILSTFKIKKEELVGDRAIQVFANKIIEYWQKKFGD